MFHLIRLIVCVFVCRCDRPLYSSPSGAAVRDWLFSLSEGLKRVRSLKLQLFCTLAGLPPISSAPPTTSLPGEQRWRSLIDICRLFMLWPRGLAIRTRSLKLSFWLRGGNEREERGKRQREGVVEERGQRRIEDQPKKQEWWKSKEWKGEIEESELGMKFIGKRSVLTETTKAHTDTRRERKKDAVNTYFPSEIEKSSECRWRAASVFPFSLNII